MCGDVFKHNEGFLLIPIVHHVARRTAKCISGCRTLKEVFFLSVFSWTKHLRDVKSFKCHRFPHAKHCFRNHFALKELFLLMIHLYPFMSYKNTTKCIFVSNASLTSPVSKGILDSLSRTVSLLAPPELHTHCVPQNITLYVHTIRKSTAKKQNKQASSLVSQIMLK